MLSVVYTIQVVSNCSLCIYYPRNTVNNCIIKMFTELLFFLCSCKLKRLTTPDMTFNSKVIPRQITDQDVDNIQAADILPHFNRDGTPLESLDLSPLPAVSVHSKPHVSGHVCTYVGIVRVSFRKYFRGAMVCMYAERRE